jgi:RNA polymerase sigma-70 factor (ECF subfamily)
MLLKMSPKARTDDRTLVQRVRAGDGEALRLLVERYQERVFALVFGIVRDAHEVEDVAQEVFLKVYTRIDAFDERSQFYTWLYRVAVNAAKDHVKKRVRRPAVPLDEADALPGPGEPPEAGAARSETVRSVRAAIGGLPVRYREVLTLRELEGLSYDEIAEVLGISIGTVESRLHRARARLKRKLQRTMEGKGRRGPEAAGSGAASRREAAGPGAASGSEAAGPGAASGSGGAGPGAEAAREGEEA